MGDGPSIPWRLLDIDILVEDKETGGKNCFLPSILNQICVIYVQVFIFSIYCKEKEMLASGLRPQH